VPHHAEIALAVIVSILVLTVDLRGAIGFSSFGVLLYYFIANISAFTQDRNNRRYPKPVQIIGAAGAWSWSQPCHPPRSASGRPCSPSASWAA
jgi:APA family basic amino acid/polyamine antiporter